MSKWELDATKMPKYKSSPSKNETFQNNIQIKLMKMREQIFTSAFIILKMYGEPVCGNPMLGVTIWSLNGVFLCIA